MYTNTHNTHDRHIHTHTDTKTNAQTHIHTKHIIAYQQSNKMLKCVCFLALFQK